jgi:hypothetical protein
LKLEFGREMNGDLVIILVMITFLEIWFVCRGRKVEARTKRSMIGRVGYDGFFPSWIPVFCGRHWVHARFASQGEQKARYVI